MPPLVTLGNSKPSLVNRVLTSTSVEEKVEKVRQQLSKCNHQKYQFECQECYNVDDYPFWCGIRICNKCEKKRRWLMKRRYGPLVAGFKGGISTKFLTITYALRSNSVRHTKKLLDKKVELYFRRVERSKEIRRIAERKEHTRIHGKLVQGGIRTMECVEKDDGVYLHYHMIIESHYLDQGELSRIWEEVTTTTKVVDIRPCRGKKQALNYLVNYITKQVKIKSDPIRFYVNHLQRTRLFTVFGVFYGHKIKRPKHAMACSMCSSENMKFKGVFESLSLGHVCVGEKYEDDYLPTLRDLVISGERDPGDVTPDELEYLLRMGVVMEVSPGVIQVV